MTDSTPAKARKSITILRLRAGLLLLVASVVLCGAGGHFLARQLGLGLGWSILVALAIWVAAGMAIARLGPKVYFAICAAVTVLLGYLVYDFSRSAIGWPGPVSLALAAVAIALMAFTFYDFRRLKHEIRVWAYRR
ncbi:hypothetical protein [Xanthobacter pseudotagetidis]|uniref:hypothetical protein n=1 Tax=Xanthobacter pseudotagetidis TaxID=3119911 RepID=UPI00372A274E